MKKKADQPSPGVDQTIYRSLDDEDFEVEALKPLIPFSMESGLNGNSKTIDNNSSNLGYRSFKAMPQKNLQTIDHGTREQNLNLEPSILSKKETINGFAVRAINEKNKTKQQQIPITKVNADLIRHGSAGVVSTTIDHSMRYGSDIELEQVSIIESNSV